MSEWIFWLLVVTIFYTYFGYALLIPLIGLFVKRPLDRRDITPRVTFLITAYNEEKNIRKKLTEVLALDYPWEQLEVMVASDGSTDRTDDIVREFRDQGVVLKRVEGRVGKTATQNEAVKAATGDVIIFSDATTVYEKDAIRKLVRNYNDPEVGAVSGRYEYVNPTGAPVGTGSILFWKYENFIKSMQTRIRTISGCCGCIYSVRKAAYVPLPGDIISDLVEPLMVIRGGYRVVFEQEAVAYEETTEKSHEEFRMRIRVITRAMRGILFARGLLNPFRFPFVAFQLFSHKVLRWLIPFFLIGLLVANAFLLDRQFYVITFVLQVAFYLLALFGLGADRVGKKFKPAAVPLYFCIVNTASLIAFFKTLAGQKMVTWETVRK
ncbi:glycosyl transferase family 2 [Geobacter metallireducens RCH3]|uniref:Glycosyltransferase, CESA-like subfamily n=1 Tax=Geobacter metallireducens (strain ATCC 53774 / DSM 7210 / GS-15) TaxID=269799 RepID=Q39U37_GEOMG|nr:glycosyltransferase family 2 protein [Geobacter metallireducens]ABB32237.1 glycosyltransferase, CESA-like subfamily [Geobacter metallireducens GS-15]EHP86995.1 glycosyl transferase family 2 [Geobacter metallireducens RCH3]